MVEIEREELLSVRDVGRMKQRHPMSIKRALLAGDLKGVKVAGRWVVRRADAEAWTPPRRGPKRRRR